MLFADPPYADREAVDVVLGSWHLPLLSPRGVMVIEQDIRVVLPVETDGARLLRRYAYGDTALFLYGRAESNARSGSLS